MSKLLNVALIGAGKIAGSLTPLEVETKQITRHLQAIHYLENFSLVAFIEPDLNHLQKVKELFPTAVHYDNLSSLLNEQDIDLVVITSPDQTHVSYIKEALTIKPQVTIFCEKPITSDARELNELKKIPTQTNIFTNHTRRFDSRYTQLKSLIDSKELGDFFKCRWDYYRGWVHNGVHLVDILRYLFGTELDYISSSQTERLEDIDVKFALKSRPKAFIEIQSFPESAFQLFETDFFFTNGRLRLKDFGNRFTIERVNVNSIGERELGKEEDWGIAQEEPPILIAYKELALHLSGQTSEILNQVSLSEAIKTMEIIYDIRKSHQN